MVEPNFILIGAGKAGTTAIYEYLIQHPQIYMSPIKEPNYFALTGEIVAFKGSGKDRNFVRDEREPIDDFISAIKAEPDRIDNHWGFGHYVRRGLYYKQVKRYFDRFNRQQIKIYLDEDLKADDGFFMTAPQLACN